MEKYQLELGLRESFDYCLIRDSELGQVSMAELESSTNFCRVKKQNKRNPSWYFYQLQIKAQPLSALMPFARKVVNTADWCANREELRQTRILDKIENLKESNLFSFRQLKRSRDPPRELCHWDYLLKEMKWMHQDFKQERKWKINAARVVGGWILEYFRLAKSRIIQENESPWSKLVYSNDMILNDDACETFHDGNKEYEDSIPSIMAVSRLFNTEIVEYWGQSGDENENDNDKDPVIYQYLFGQNEEYLMTEPKAENATRTELFWSLEEDDMLFSLASIYQHNWELLADILSASFRKKSDRDCYSRFTALNSRGYKPTVEYDSFVLPIRQKEISLFNNRHADLERIKLAKFMTKFDMIGKAVKKKELPKQNSNKSNKGQVNLNSHETHMQSQIHAGVDILGLPLSPLELSQLKEMRNNELRAAQEQQKHAALFSGISRGMPRGGISHSTTGYPTHRQGSYGLATPVQKSMSVQKSSPTIPEIRFSASSPLNSPGRVVSPVQLDASSSNEKLSAGSPLTSTISNQPPVILQSNKARQQIQNDVQTAAALAALQNVKNQTVIKEEGNSNSSPRSLRRKK